MVGSGGISVAHRVQADVPYGPEDVQHRAGLLLRVLTQNKIYFMSWTSASLIQYGTIRMTSHFAPYDTIRMTLHLAPRTRSYFP